MTKRSNLEKLLKWPKVAQSGPKFVSNLGKNYFNVGENDISKWSSYDKRQISK